MKDTTQKAIEKLFERHDILDLGVRGGGGTALTRSWECRFCGLHFSCFNDIQNGIKDQYSFSDIKKGPISLKEAINLKCGGEQCA